MLFFFQTYRKNKKMESLSSKYNQSVVGDKNNHHHQQKLPKKSASNEFNEPSQNGFSKFHDSDYK